MTYIEIRYGEEYNRIAANPRNSLKDQTVVRGSIYDCNGVKLAYSEENNGYYTRRYPYDNLYSHVIGYVSKDFNHRTLIEAQYNSELLGDSSFASLTDIVNTFKDSGKMGSDITLTINHEMQKTANDAMGNHNGAIVALNVKTGEILAMVSKPDFNPNLHDFVKDLEDTALYCRAIQFTYPPGSTFKILTALEFIRENETYETYTYDCEGKDTFGEVVIHCYNGNQHGEEDLEKAFAKSCNTAFSQIGMDLDKASFRELCDIFLFNKALPTNLPSNASSFVVNKKTLDEEMPQTAIGQGETQITPLHNALITATIANEGIMMKPYVIDRLETHTGQVVKQYKPEQYDEIITKEEAKEVAKLMEAVVEDGTASALNGLSSTCAGKTGSAEYNSNKASHAWFVGYAPVENPEIVVSIIVEDGGSGSKTAVPIAKKMFESYLKK